MKDLFLWALVAWAVLAVLGTAFTGLRAMLVQALRHVAGLPPKA